MKCLVTGVAGFIGSHVADELLKLGHKVVGVDNLSGGFREHVPEGVDFWVADCVDRDRMRYLFEVNNGFDVVYHLAAYAAEGLSPFIRTFNYENNVVASANLISLAIEHRCRRFVFTSSMAVYGEYMPPFTEDAPMSPVDPYGIAKMAVEKDLQVAYYQHGMLYTIFRPHNVYGPRQNYMDPYRNVVGIFLRQAMAGAPLTVYGDGTQTRAFSYIQPTARIIAQSAFSERFVNRIFNIGGDQHVTIRDLAADVVRAMYGEYATPEIVHLPARKEVAHAWCSHDKLKSALPGVNLNEVSFSTGMEHMIRWARTAKLERTKLPPIELPTGLYPYWQQFLSQE